MQAEYVLMKLPQLCHNPEPQRVEPTGRAGIGGLCRQQAQAANTGEQEAQVASSAHTHIGQSFANTNTCAHCQHSYLDQERPCHPLDLTSMGKALPLPWFRGIVPMSNNTSSLGTSLFLCTFTWDFGVSTFTQVFFGSPYIPSRDPESSPSFQKPLELFT